MKREIEADTQAETDRDADTDTDRNRGRDTDREKEEIQKELREENSRGWQSMDGREYGVGREEENYITKHRE